MNAIDVLAHLIDSGSWATAAEVSRLHVHRDAAAPPLDVAKLCMLHRGDLDVVMALTSGRVKRARLNVDGSISKAPWDYVNVNEDATVMSLRTPALCAALAIWLTINPLPERGRPS